MPNEHAEMCSCGESKVVPNILVVIRADDEAGSIVTTKYCRECLEALVDDAGRGIQLAAVRLIAVINSTEVR